MRACSSNVCGADACAAVHGYDVFVTVWQTCYHLRGEANGTTTQWYILPMLASLIQGLPVGYKDSLVQGQGIGTTQRGCCASSFYQFPAHASVVGAAAVAQPVCKDVICSFWAEHCSPEVVRQRPLGECQPPPCFL